MLELMSYCPVHGYDHEALAYPGQLYGFLQDNDLSGIELSVYGQDRFSFDFGLADITGAHLRHWPSWIEKWTSSERETWVNEVVENLALSLSYRPKYLVWHVGHCSSAECFTRQFSYTPKHVLDCTAELFTLVKQYIPDDVLVLFENLWWPGLTLTEPKLVDGFFEKLQSPNVGIMLDTGHLMNTNPCLRNEEEGVRYIADRIASLGSCADLIKGVHLSCSLSGEYQLNAPKTPSGSELFQHIMSIDQHRPFTAASVRSVLDMVSPEYLVHELTYASLHDLPEKLKLQRACM